jgi:predicted phosphodiesterase
MRVAAIYDVHGNLPALEAVLEDVRRERVDQIVVGGDVVPGPMPRETIDCLLNVDVPVQFILGNGDREVLAQMQVKRQTPCRRNFARASAGARSSFLSNTNSCWRSGRQHAASK